MVDEEKDVRKYIQETIVKDGLGIHDATEKEIDILVGYKSNAQMADFTLADMISRRAQIGVSRPSEDDLSLVVYPWSFSGRCQYLCSGNSCAREVNGES